MVDTSGNGEVDEHELAAAMRGPAGLAQIEGDGSLDRPTVAGIMEKCDASGNGEISKKEAHDCINKHVSKGMQAEAHQFVDQVWDMVDTSGNGEVSEKELAAAMRGPPPALAQGDGSL